MEEDKKAQIAKDWIQKLANGINPLDGSTIKDDDIVNNVHISRCLFYVAELIDATMQPKEKKSRDYVCPFHMRVEDLGKVRITEKAGIAQFTREINRVIPADMKPLASTRILSWLMDNGFLQEEQKEDGGKTKYPTEAGNKIGIFTEQRTGVQGPFISVQYNADAQRFILNNLYTIIES